MVTAAVATAFRVLVENGLENTDQALHLLNREVLRVGRRGVPQLVHEGLHGVVVFLAFLADIAVGAHGETVETGRSAEA